MKIQKYKAKRVNDDVELIGYIIEVRKYDGDGVYSPESNYLMVVNAISSPGGQYGQWFVQADTIEKIED